MVASALAPEPGTNPQRVIAATTAVRAPVVTSERFGRTQRTRRPLDENNDTTSPHIESAFTKYYTVPMGECHRYLVIRPAITLGLQSYFTSEGLSLPTEQCDRVTYRDNVNNGDQLRILFRLVRQSGEANEAPGHFCTMDQCPRRLAP